MTESAKQRQADAIGAAREYYRLARASLDPMFSPGRPPIPNPERACAQALLGILRLQIELVEGQWDAPCDCFEEMPEPSELFMGEPH